MIETTCAHCHCYIGGSFNPSKRHAPDCLDHPDNIKTQRDALLAALEDIATQATQDVNTQYATRMLRIERTARAAVALARGELPASPAAPVQSN